MATPVWMQDGAEVGSRWWGVGPGGGEGPGEGVGPEGGEGPGEGVGPGKGWGLGRGVEGFVCC